MLMFAERHRCRVRGELCHSASCLQAVQRTQWPISRIRDRFLSNGDEFGRGNKATGWVVPAEQRFSTDHLTCGIDLRLVHEMKFVIAKSCAEVGFERGSLGDIGLHLRIE